jgi:hypothetical protein
MTIQTTDTDTLESSVIAVLHGITPKHTIAQDDKWNHRGEGRKGNMSKTRRFHIEWTWLGYVDGGFFTTETGTGVETAYQMDIVADYRIPHQHAAQIVGKDHTQVFYEIHKQLRRDTATPLVVTLEDRGIAVDDENDSGDVVQLRHMYEVSFMESWGS